MLFTLTIVLLVNDVVKQYTQKAPSLRTPVQATANRTNELRGLFRCAAGNGSG
jgi:hypothetical protein